MVIHATWLGLLLLSYLQMVAKGMVRLYPSDVQVDVGSWATFTCNVSCDLSQSHTVKWFVGEFPHNQRQVDSGFKLRTGIDTEITDVSVCGATVTTVKQDMEQELRIKVSSAQTMNKTAVQCAALRKGPSYQDLYSHYSMIIVNDEPETTTHSTTEYTPQMSSEDSTPSELPTATVTVEPSRCQTATVTSTLSQFVTVTVIETATVEVTNTPLPSDSLLLSGNGDLQTVSSSISLIIILVLMQILV